MNEGWLHTHMRGQPLPYHTNVHGMCVRVCVCACVLESEHPATVQDDRRENGADSGISVHSGLIRAAEALALVIERGDAQVALRTFESAGRDDVLRPVAVITLRCHGQPHLLAAFSDCIHSIMSGQRKHVGVALAHIQRKHVGVALAHIQRKHVGMQCACRQVLRTG